MNASKQTILIIDDNVENRYTFGRYLKREGFEVQEAGTGGEGLQKAKTIPALIMLDIQLPDIIGYDVCRQLRNNPLTKFIPVLHTSATFTESSDRTEGLSHGADGFLVQPIDPEELIATVKALLRIRKAEAEANKLAQQWNATFDAINDGVCLVDHSGVILRSNGALKDILGKSDLENKSLPSLLKEKGLPWESFRESMRTGQGESETIEIGHRSFLVGINPVQVGFGQAAEFACVFSDVTLIKKAEKSLQSLNEELEIKVQQRTADLNDVNGQLESFCYSVAHDLRAPIRTMQGFSDILLEDYSHSLDEEAQRYLHRIHKSAQRMDRLIQDLLRYSRLSREEIRLENVDLLECVSAVISDNQRDFEQANAVFKTDIPENTFVRANATTLRQAISNILSNAVKFVAPGVSPCVNISYDQREHPCLLIRDNGIGIDSEHLEKIFDIFERIHSDSYAGTGIGLAIVRRAMERMCGEVSVKSSLGQGTTFYLQFNKRL